ncbi:MAG TPA: flavodoxin domain-containing protein [Polyangiaceae bacterium]|nr:flavodoxin domain-containing protein [Polyangiaceae bacterium]
MSVLIAYAGASASTVEIARQLADRLVKAGFTALVRPIEQVESVRPYRAVLLGSELREQALLPELGQFLSRFSAPLSALPVWSFSNAELGAPIPTFHRVREHRHFSGSFQRSGTRRLGDLFLKICGGSSGDHRDWRQVNAWAADITRELQHIDHLKERRRLHLSVRGRP